MDPGDERIAQLGARLTCQGDPAFDDFARACGVPNAKQTTREKLRTWAQLDALVATAYRLSRDEYVLVLDSFRFKRKEVDMLLAGGDADWSSHATLSSAYSIVRDWALVEFERLNGLGRGPPPPWMVREAEAARKAAAGKTGKRSKRSKEKAAA